MIIDFSISNFRSIREPQLLSFEATGDTHLEDYYVVKKGKYRLLKMATILGANASGKTNIIRAFSMFPQLILQPCETKTSQIHFEQFALDPDYNGKDTEMAINFLCNDKKYCYTVGFNNRVVSHELLQCHPFGELRSHKVYERFTDKDTGMSTIKWGEKYRAASATRDLNTNLLHNRTVFGAYQVSNIHLPWMKEIVDWVSTYLLPPVNNSEQGLFGYVSKQIDKQILDKKVMANLLTDADLGICDFLFKKEVKDIPQELITFILEDESAPAELKAKLKENPTAEEFKVELVHRGNQIKVPFEFSQESGGTQRYYELLGILLMLVKEPHFVAIDELECRLHPDLYEYFITLFLTNAQESQLVYTTHMREFLNDKDLFRDDSVWLTEKSDIGATELYSIADFDSNTLRASTNRYNAYNVGLLGAVPKLGATYIQSIKTKQSNE